LIEVKNLSKTYQSGEERVMALVMWSSILSEEISYRSWAVGFREVNPF